MVNYLDFRLFWYTSERIKLNYFIGILRYCFLNIHQSFVTAYNVPLSIKNNSLVIGIKEHNMECFRLGLCCKCHKVYLIRRQNPDIYLHQTPWSYVFTSRDVTQPNKQSHFQIVSAPFRSGLVLCRLGGDHKLYSHFIGLLTQLSQCPRLCGFLKTLSRKIGFVFFLGCWK